MVGDFENEENKGIIPRTFDYIFQKVNMQKEKNDKFDVYISFIQIYLEMIQDLFEPSNEVKIRENPEKGVFLENVKWIKVKSTKECFENFVKGEKNRATAFTEMNAHSSRSHALLITKINKSLIDNNSTEHIMTESFLYLVDLAGSERVNKTNAKEDRLKEARKINFSLLVLGNCIQKLTDPRNTHVSYRDSKLTRILQESLGGNAKTSLIVTISPSNYNCDETISSLNFGSRAMKVKNKPQVNKTEDYQAQCFKLQEDYDKLMEKFTKLKIDYDKVCDENNKLKNGETFVELQRLSLKNQINKRDGVINEILKRNSNGNLNNNSVNLNNNNINDENKNGFLLNEEQEKEINLLKEDNEKLKNELKKLESFYQQKDKLQEQEKQNFLRDLDKIFREKEDDYEEQIKNLNLENDVLKSSVADLSKDKDDLTKENSELQISYNDILNRNDELKREIEDNEKKYQQLKNDFQIKNKKLENIENIKKNMKSDNTQTYFFDEDLKNELIKIGINKQIIALNDTNSIIKNLVIQNNQNNIEQNKLNKLKEANNLLVENYDKKLLEKENIILKLNDDLKEKENEIKDLEEKIEQVENQTEENKQIYNKELLNIKNDFKLLTVNSKSTDSELKRIQNTFLSYERGLNKQMNSLNNDLNNLSKIKKGIKSIDSIIETDLPIILNSKNNDNILNKLKNQLLNNQSVFDDYQNNSNQNTQSINYDMQALIEKLSENLKENKNFIVYILNSYFKICKELYETYKTRVNRIFDINEKGRDDLAKKNLLFGIKESLDKYSKFVYNGNVNDLKEKINSLLNNINKYNTSELMNIILQIIDDLIMRISSCKTEQQLEIENLNEKVIYFLREIEIYKKSEKTNNITEKYDKLVSLKEQEINRLNRTIKNNLEKIKELTTQNYLYHSNSDSTFSSFSNFSMNKEEAKLKIVQNEKDIDELSKELEKIQAQQREIEQKQNMKKQKK